MYEITLTANEQHTLAASRYNAQEVIQILSGCNQEFDGDDTTFSVPRRQALEIVGLGAKEDFVWPDCGDRLTRKLNEFCEVFFD